MLLAMGIQLSILQVTAKENISSSPKLALNVDINSWNPETLGEQSNFSQSSRLLASYMLELSTLSCSSCIA